MLSQHISGNRPINEDAALIYSTGLGVPIGRFSPRLDDAIRKFKHATTSDASHLTDSLNDDDAAVTIAALKQWRLQASHRSQKVIDQLMALAQTDGLKEEDWKLIEQMVGRLRNR